MMQEAHWELLLSQMLNSPGGNAQERVDKARPISAVANLRMTSSECSVPLAFDTAASLVARMI